MDVLIERCAGIDIGKDEVVACVRTPGPGGRVRQKQTRTFATFSGSLEAMADWFAAEGVTAIVMEATGSYWKPVWYVLEDRALEDRALEDRVGAAGWVLTLVNARSVKFLPGHKSDVLDAEWLAELLEHGLLRGSFVPPPTIRQLRDLTRYRKRLIQDHTSEGLRIQKTLEDAGIKLGSVAADVLGVSGRAMLAALVAGERDPAVLAGLAKAKLRNKIPALRQALRGRFSDHHALLIGMSLEHIAFLETRIARLDEQVDTLFATHTITAPATHTITAPATHTITAPASQTGAAPTDAAPTGAAPTGAAPTDAAPTGAEAGVPFARARDRLDTITGVGKRAAETIIAEIGVDMSHFPTAAHLASWAGLAPGSNITGGKRRSGKTTQGDAWLVEILTQCAWAAAHTRDTYLAAQFWRLARRIGKKKAAIAVAHSILVICWHLLAYDQDYTDLGGDYFTRRNTDRHRDHLIRQLQDLGYYVTLDKIA